MAAGAPQQARFSRAAIGARGVGLRFFAFFDAFFDFFAFFFGFFRRSFGFGFFFVEREDRDIAHWRLDRDRSGRHCRADQKQKGEGQESRRHRPPGIGCGHAVL